MEDSAWIIELVVISANELKRVRKFGYQVCYAVAYIYPDKTKSTRSDTDGSLNPRWNEKLSLPCDNRLLHQAGTYITVDIYSHGTLESKMVGTVKIPIQDVVKQASREPKLMTLQVIRPSGKAKGTLNLSVKLKNKGDQIQSAAMSSQPLSYAYSRNYKQQQSQRADSSRGDTRTEGRSNSAAFPAMNSRSNVRSSTTYPSNMTVEPVRIYPARSGLYSPPFHSINSPSTSSSVFPSPKEPNGVKMEENSVRGYPSYSQGAQESQQHSSHQYSSRYPRVYYSPHGASAPYNYARA